MATVTVGCKLPNGLKLRVHGFVERHEQVMGGGTRLVKQAVQQGQTFTLNGFARDVLKAPEHPIRGGYALTYGVDAEFMATWMKQNESHPAVANKLIIVHEKASMIEGQAKEQAKVRSGLEPVDPNNLPMKQIKPADAKED